MVLSLALPRLPSIKYPNTHAGNMQCLDAGSSSPVLDASHRQQPNESPCLDKNSTVRQAPLLSLMSRRLDPFQSVSNTDSVPSLICRYQPYPSIASNPIETCKSRQISNVVHCPNERRPPGRYRMEWPQSSTFNLLPLTMARKYLQCTSSRDLTPSHLNFILHPLSPFPPLLDL